MGGIFEFAPNQQGNYIGHRMETGLMKRGYGFGP